MTIGALRRQIVIEQRSGARDALNQAPDTWATVCTCYADIQPQSGREMLAADAMVSEVSALIEIRYRTGINAGMRAVYGSQVFNIAAVIDIDSRHRMLQLVCTQGANQG